MLPSFANRTVTITHPGAKSQRGTTVPDWDNPESVTRVDGCNVQTPTTGMELDGRTATTLGGTVYMPAGTIVHAGDRIDYGSHSFMVVGEPMVWESPTGALDHVQVRIAEWEG